MEDQVFYINLSGLTGDTSVDVSLDFEIFSLTVFLAVLKRRPELGLTFTPAHIHMIYKPVWLVW